MVFSNHKIGKIKSTMLIMQKVNPLNLGKMRMRYVCTVYAYIQFAFCLHSLLTSQTYMQQQVKDSDEEDAPSSKKRKVERKQASKSQKQSNTQQVSPNYIIGTAELYTSCLISDTMIFRHNNRNSGSTISKRD